jgi:hypothetical protein
VYQNLRREQSEGEVATLPSDLAKIVEAWSGLPEHIRQAVITLVASVTVAARDDAQGV